MLRSIPLYLSLIFIFMTSFNRNTPTRFSMKFFGIKKTESSVITDSDTSKINSLNRNAFNLQRTSPDSASAFARKALLWSQKINYIKGIADAYITLGIIHISSFSNYDSSAFYLNKAKPLCEQLNYQLGMGRIHYAFAYYYSFKGNLEESERQLYLALKFFNESRSLLSQYNTYSALVYIVRQYKKYNLANEYLQKNIILAKQLDNNALLSNTYNDLGNLLNEQGLNQSAINAYFQALKLAEQSGDTNCISITYGSIGNLYYNQKDYSEALNYLKKKLEISVSLNNSWETSKTYNSIAMAYHDLLLTDSAIYYQHLSLALNNSMNYNSGIAEAYYNLSKYHFALKNSDSASYYIYKAIKLGQSSNTEANLAKYYIHLGSLFESEGKTSKAIREAERAYHLAKNLNMPSILMEASYQLSNLYRTSDKNNQAYYYLSEYIILKDSLINAEHLQNITRLEMKNEFDKKERQITFEKEQNELRYNDRLKQQKLYMAGAVGIFFLLIILVVLFFRNKNVSIKLKSIDLEQRLLRAQMNPHFIFNSLCSIQDFLIKNKTEDANNFLTRFAVLMRAILEQSRKDFIPLEEEIKTLKNYLEIQKLRFEKDFDYTIQVDEKIDTETFSIPPMLGQPFIENSIEHGLLPKEDKGKLEIKYTLASDSIQFEVIDNGIGRTASYKKTTTKDNYDKKSLATILTLERLSALKNVKLNKVKFEISDLKEPGIEGTKVAFFMPYIVA